jgi:hypothetical protein
VTIARDFDPELCGSTKVRGTNRIAVPDNRSRFAGSARGEVAPVPRLALTIEEACAALGYSWDFWRAHIEPGVRVVRRGRKKLVPVRELERWLEQEANRVFE